MVQVVGGLRPAALRVQWVQLLVLAGVHFLVDMFGNALPSILPAIREEFSLTLTMGTLVIASLGLASNAFQILTGHLRSHQTRPFFLYVGLLLAAAVCLMALAPRSALGVVLLLVFGTISGFGIAVAHPEGLRAVHTLRRIPASWSTALFMTTGFFGSACGAVVAARLVHAYGLKGLYPLMVCPSVGILAVGLSRVRLAVEHGSSDVNRLRGSSRQPVASDGAGAAGRSTQPVRASPPQPLYESCALPFRKVMLVGLPAALSTTAVQWMTPTYLHELGFELTAGGFAAAMFGWGGAVGPFLWAALAGRMGDLPACAWSFVLSVVFALAYFVLATHAAAVWLLFGAGFCSMSGYILTVTLARSAGGLCLGHRMSLIVGGTWGIAFVVLLGLMAIADRVGMGPLLKLTPLGYLASALYAFYVLRQYPLLARSHQRASAADLADPEQASA